MIRMKVSVPPAFKKFTKNLTGLPTSIKEYSLAAAEKIFEEYKEDVEETGRSDGAKYSLGWQGLSQDWINYKLFPERWLHEGLLLSTITITSQQNMTFLDMYVSTDRKTKSGKDVASILEKWDFNGAVRPRELFKPVWVMGGFKDKWFVELTASLNSLFGT